MKQLMSGDTFLSLMTLVALWCVLGYEVVAGKRKARAAAVHDAALVARFRQLRLRLWNGAGVCAGVEAEVGVLIARAERAGRAAFVSEQRALAALARCAQEDGPRETAVLSAGEHAVQAEERMRRLLRGLKLFLPDVAAADLDAAQEAFRVYRDHHVRMCREGRASDADRMQVRHLVSETVTLARIADLEDLAAVGGIAI